MTVEWERQSKTLTRLRKYARIWHINLNVGRCKIMHIDKNNIGHAYKILSPELALTAQERNPGLSIDSFSEGITSMYNRNQKISLNVLRIKPESIILPRYKTLGHLCIDCCLNN